MRHRTLIPSQPLGGISPLTGETLSALSGHSVGEESTLGKILHSENTHTRELTHTRLTLSSSWKSSGISDRWPMETGLAQGRPRLQVEPEAFCGTDRFGRAFSVNLALTNHHPAWAMAPPPRPGTNLSSPGLAAGYDPVKTEVCSSGMESEGRSFRHGVHSGCNAP